MRSGTSGTVRGHGYRMLAASEHMSVALAKKESAEGYFRRAIALLEDVREHELTPAELHLFRGTSLIWGGVAAVMAEADRRTDRIEGLIDDLRNRVERLETDT